MVDDMTRIDGRGMEMKEKDDNIVEPKNQVLKNADMVSYRLDKAYLERLHEEYCIYSPDDDSDIEELYKSRIRALRVKRCVTDRAEKTIDCFKNILSLFAKGQDTLALVIKRTPQAVEMYFVVKDGEGIGGGFAKTKIELLATALQGNLPGTEIELIEKQEDKTKIKRLMELFRFDADAVSILSNVPSEKSEYFLSQGIEKLLNGVVPQEKKDSYTLVLLAEALSMVDVWQLLSAYETMASELTPFAGYQFQQGENEASTEGQMEAFTHSRGISEAISKTHSLHIGLLSNVSGGYGYSRSETKARNEGDASTTGKNHSVSIGTSKSSTYTYQSYLVKDLLTRLEAIIARIEQSKSGGLWRYAAYVFSETSITTKNVANFLRSLTQGDTSHIEPTVIQTWWKEGRDGEDVFTQIQNQVQRFSHPVFFNSKKSIYLTATSEITTAELAALFTFPHSSVHALPVIECTRFGREPHALAPLPHDVKLGCSYHMHQVERRNPVYIGKDELTKHTFITGTTGAGKSNTIYRLLGELCPEKRAGSESQKEAVTFLVIEPAKGEYKDVFGGRQDVTVYGTNPYKTPHLLQINPFYFPTDTHVMEHIDRLVEIFNACWPMYAAMPAILREGIEEAYKAVGWNLKSSRPKTPGKFPTFAHLLEVLPKVIQASGYSADTNRDYQGALITRVRSLTRGIHGQIFRQDMDAKVLFSQNAIVDLSRVGSAETKALLMGILVLRLQEYRMAEGTVNSGLRHVTVLEEAHQLLRRTSSEQVQESANLQGKAVEMISQAIAEMRTYGEGFVISDQSPGLMDLAVIRNTNTKIILRLPDEGDRLLVGKAIGLTDAQIAELSRLECGVAAISQSNWLEPVLCKIDEFEAKRPMSATAFTWEDGESKILHAFWRAAVVKEPGEMTEEGKEMIRQWVIRRHLGERTVPLVEKVLQGAALTPKECMWLLAEALHGAEVAGQKSVAETMANIEKMFWEDCGEPPEDDLLTESHKVLAHFYPLANGVR